MTAKKGAAIYGAILIGILVIMFALISALLIREIHIERQDAALKVAQANIEQKQQAIQKRDAEIKRQQDAITKQAKLIQAQQKTIQALSSRAGVDPAHITVGPWQHFVATWYSYQGGVGSGTITRTGAHVQNGVTIAVDPAVIPLGSIVQVKFSDGTVHVYRATDTGGSIIGSRIDIFSSSEQSCVQNGRQAVLVRIVKKG